MNEAVFYFDFGSPNAYLVHRVLPRVEARIGAGFRFDYRPVLLGGLFKLNGNQSPMMAYAGIPNKLAYERQEMARFITRHELTAFRMNPHFPVNTLMMMRGAVAAQAIGLLAPYAEAMFHFMWEDPRKLDDPQILVQAWEQAGLPAGALKNGLEDPLVKERLVANTQQAFEQGVFGVPSFLVGEDLFFGKERLGQVEEAILACRGDRA